LSALKPLVAILRATIVAMIERQAFGTNLRRIRMQRGISIAQIVAATNVGARFWEALENNDLSRWPNGIYARAYVRGYAKVVGVDPESTVDEFCRCFPQGDRRAEFLIRGQAEIVGHKDLQWRDHVPPVAGETDRRGAAAASASAGETPAPHTTTFGQVFVRLRAMLRA
jgi:transcriptional regulator with XRE-family HTH domain